MANMLGEGWLEDVRTKPKDFLEKTFLKSCEKGYLDRIAHLLICTDLHREQDIQKILNDGLLHAAKNGKLNVVQYLLTSKELNIHAEIHYDNDSAFSSAVRYGHLDIVKYLHSSTDLKEHANIKASESTFLLAIAYRFNDVVQYLVFDGDMEITDRLINFAKARNNNQVEKWFEQKALMNNLNESLPCDNISLSNKKSKI